MVFAWSVRGSFKFDTVGYVTINPFDFLRERLCRIIFLSPLPPIVVRVTTIGQFLSGHSIFSLELQYF